VALPQRLLFGEVADLYDRHRPSYPAALVDDLLARAGLEHGRRAIEVGAGTGKATELFAARGAAVLAVEPSPPMAALARRRCAAYPGVEVVESDFEALNLGDETFPLLYAAQAWHWIDPDVRYRRARAALAAGGLLAVFWNRPAWGPTELRAALSAAYRRYAPDMPADSPLHPDNPSPQGDDDWPAEIAAVPEFSAPEVQIYRWSQDYDARAYAALLNTLSDFQRLEADRRVRLLDAVASAIADRGGILTMPLITRLHTAHAVGIR
jgi:SAM-dependent methyltransferase